MIRFLVNALLFLFAAVLTVFGIVLAGLALLGLANRPAADPFGLMTLGVVGCLLVGMGLIWLAEILSGA